MPYYYEVPNLNPKQVDSPHSGNGTHPSGTSFEKSTVTRLGVIRRSRRCGLSGLVQGILSRGGRRRGGFSALVGAKSIFGYEIIIIFPAAYLTLLASHRRFLLLALPINLEFSRLPATVSPYSHPYCGGTPAAFYSGYYRINLPTGSGSWRSPLRIF